MDNGSKRQIGGQSEKQGVSSEQGFTLIETAIALIIMMVMALAVCSLFVLSIGYNAGANERAVALAIAQQRMERLRKTRFTDAALNTPSSTETYLSNGHSYSIQTSICSTADCGGSPVSKVITVQVTPQAAGTQWARTPATIISKRSAPSVGAYLP